MDLSLPAPSTASDSNTCASDATPFDLETITITRREHVALKTNVAYYKTMQARATQRVEALRSRHQREVAEWQVKYKALQATLEQTKAQLRGLRQQAFGKRSERAKSVKLPQQDLTVNRGDAIRPRGQQPGWQGHGRTLEAHLPVREQVLAVDPCCCSRCGLGFVEMAGTQDAQVLEIEVKAYRRLVRRQRLRASCQCRALPGIVTAAAPPQLIPRGKLGVSLLVEALLSKYRHGVPTYRLLQQWQDLGLSVAQGTLTGNLQQLLPLFTPIVDAGLKRLRASSAWHADETRWEVFDPARDKLSTRHYLWVFQSADVTHFVVDPSRAASVPKAVLEGVTCGVLSVDRYAAYGKYARETPGIELAYCWAHQRRDFLYAANQFPALAHWALDWVERIGQLYALHQKRCALALEPTSDAFVLIDQLLRDQLDGLYKHCQAQLRQNDLHAKAHAVLRSMVRHWPGLMTFIEHPKIDLDNNQSERSLRPAVVGRKNYYGSGSQASAQLAATMLSLFTTLGAWHINPRQWLTEYLHACALAGRQPPANCSPFIPWQMDETRLATLRQD